MRKILALVLVVSFAVFTCPVLVTAAARQQTGGVSGVATDAAKKPLPNHKIQLRDAKGQLAGEATSNAAGEFKFAGIQPGTYTIEIVDAAGNVLGTATVTVTADREAKVVIAATALGVAAVAAGAAGGLAGLLTGTSLLVISAAVAGGITIAYLAAREPASPSR